MLIVERIRESRFRYAIPWSMTVARPIIGADALKEAQQGNWKNAKKKFAWAWTTDLEGYPARYFNATSALGAVGDPIADGILRAESAKALAPHMPTTATIVAAAELYNIAINTKIQQGRTKPYVPLEAKLGTTVQAAGVIWAIDGMEKNSLLKRTVGRATIYAGTGLRVHAYWKELNKIGQEKKQNP